MKKTISLILCLFLISLLVGCAPAEKKCSADEDCLPATCCHPSEAVNKEHAPNCKGMLCTAECVPETIDCGQGEIKCVKGSCEVVLKE